MAGCHRKLATTNRPIIPESLVLGFMCRSGQGGLVPFWHPKSLSDAFLGSPSAGQKFMSSKEGSVLYSLSMNPGSGWLSKALDQDRKHLSRFVLYGRIVSPTVFDSWTKYYFTYEMLTKKWIKQHLPVPRGLCFCFGCRNMETLSSGSRNACWCKL